MADPPITPTCFRCGRPLVNLRFCGEENLVGPDGAPTAQRVMGSKRTFKGECPEHGEQFWHLPRFGNHSTGVEAQLGDLFPKALRGAVRQRLDRTACQRFRLALLGKLQPEPAEVARWLEVLREVQAEQPGG